MDGANFVAKVVPEKKHYKEFGRIHMKKTKLFIVYLILGIVFYAADFCFTAFADLDLDVYLITMSYLLIFYCLFMGDFLGSSSYKAINKKLQGNTETFYFGETGFSIYSEVQSSNIRYDAIESVYESPEIFALYVNKNVAQIIPKSSFVEGEPEAFRHFMEEKVAGKVKVVSTSNRTALKIVAAVLIFAAMMGGLVLAGTLQKHRAEAPETYTCQEYTVTLPGNFSEVTAEGFEYALESRDAVVLVGKETFDEVAEYLPEPVTMQSYAANIMEYNEITEDMREPSTDGTARFSYYVEDDDTEYFYYFVISEGDNAFWLTNFCCESSDAEAYYDDFVTWADSITVK